MVSRGDPKLEVLISFWHEERGRSYPTSSDPPFSMSSQTNCEQASLVRSSRESISALWRARSATSEIN